MYFMIHWLRLLQQVTIEFLLILATDTHRLQPIDAFLEHPNNRDLKKYKISQMKWTVLQDFKAILKVCLQDFCLIHLQLNSIYRFLIAWSNQCPQRNSWPSAIIFNIWKCFMSIRKKWATILLMCNLHHSSRKVWNGLTSIITAWVTQKCTSLLWVSMFELENACLSSWFPLTA